MSGLVYDTGALLAAARGDRQMWARHLVALRRMVSPVVPAPVLAQAWRGGPQPMLSRLLAGCRVHAFGETEARQVGALLAAAGTSDVVDAAVIWTAAQLTAAVCTSDPRDLAHLAEALGRQVAVIAV